MESIRSSKLVLKDPNLLDHDLKMSGYNHSSYADKIGLNRTYLQQIFNGTRNPSPVTAKKIAAGVDKEIKDYFFYQSSVQKNTLVPKKEVQND